MHYTGLSRFSAMQNVVIQNLNEDEIITDPSCVEETIRLRNEQYIDLCYLPVYKMPDNSLKLVFHNISSLRKHIGTVKRDRNYLFADVLGFSESRLRKDSPNSEYAIDGFQEVIRNDLEKLDGNGNPFHGTAVYIRNTHTLVEKTQYSEISLEWTLIKLLDGKSGKIHQIGFVYIQPNCCRRKIKASLQDLAQKIDFDSSYTIMGDFNIDETITSNASMCLDMQQYFKSEQLVRDFTTIHRTRIDLVFGNIPAVNVNTISSMISDHSIVTAYVDH
jgi:exonuclease III